MKPSDETNIVSQSAPVVSTPDPKATPPAVTPPAATPPAATPPAGDPTWLPERLEQAKRSFAKELGFDSIEEAKKAGDAKKKAEEANKTEEEKRKEAEKEAKKLRSENDAQKTALQGYATSEMNKLTPAQQAAVKGIAGDDPAKQLSTIQSLMPTWASGAAPAANASDGKSGDTAPPREAPKGINSNEGAPDLQAIYDEWKDKNPVWAARFALNNGLFEKKK